MMRSLGDGAQSIRIISTLSMSVSMDEKWPGHGTNNFYHRISQTIRFLNLEQECGYNLSCEFLSFSILHSSPSNSHRPRSTTAEWLHEKIITILKSIDTKNSFITYEVDKRILSYYTRSIFYILNFNTPIKTFLFLSPTNLLINPALYILS